MVKPFKTYKQQLQILQDRGLDVGNTSETIHFLEESNYYDVINGYKDPFILKEDNGKSVVPETYKPNTKLTELYSLYKLDRELRLLFLKYFLTFESNMRSRCAYRFAEKFKDKHLAYLDFANYSNRSEKFNDVLKTISTLSNIISRYANKSTENSIKHYLKCHGEVPLWVLVDYFTFGNISFFYSSLDDNLMNSIARDFNDQWYLDYNSTISLHSDDIEGIVQSINYFRNVCAHEEILYTMKINRPRNNSFFTKFYSQTEPTYTLPIKFNLFTIYLMLKLVLRKQDFNELKSSLKKTFKAFEPSFSSVSLYDILQTSGFPKNWYEY